MLKYFAFATTAHGRESTPTRLRQREIVILSGRPSTPATKIVTEGLRFFVGLPTSLFLAWVSHQNTSSACASAAAG